MSPELIAAVKDRILRGHSKDSISAELREAGHNEDMVELAYEEAKRALAGEAVGQPVTSGSLPEATKLARAGWGFAESRSDFIVFLAAPLLLITVIEYLADHTLWGTQGTFLIAGSILSLAAMVWYVLNLNALLFTVINAPERKVEYSESLTWARANFWNLTWLYLLGGLVVGGGLLLLIVPGIIVAISIYFSQYAYAKEGVRGLAALLRSRHLVRGNWWPVFTRLFLVGLLFFAALMIFGILVGIIEVAINNPDVTGLILDLGTVVLGAAFSVVSAHIGFTLFSHLSATSGNHLSGGRWQYQALIALFLLVITLVTVLVLGWNSDGPMRRGFDINNQADGYATFQVREQLNEAGAQAEVYYQSHEDSYLGVCPAITPVIETASEVVCNDEEDGYAISAAVGEETWCADNTGFAKLIKVPLEDRTACFNWPASTGPANATTTVEESPSELLPETSAY